MKDLAIFSSELIFLILTFLRKSQQSICSCICFVLVVVNLKIVLRELLNPMDLSGACVFYIYKVTKVVMAYEDKYFMFAAF